MLKYYMWENSSSLSLFPFYMCVSLYFSVWCFGNFLCAFNEIWWYNLPYPPLNSPWISHTGSPLNFISSSLFSFSSSLFLNNPPRTFNAIHRYIGCGYRLRHEHTNGHTPREKLNLSGYQLPKTIQGRFPSSRLEFLLAWFFCRSYVDKCSCCGFMSTISVFMPRR